MNSRNAMAGQPQRHAVAPPAVIHSPAAQGHQRDGVKPAVIVIAAVIAREEMQADAEQQHWQPPPARP